jgi:hypothetical protein
MPTKNIFIFGNPDLEADSLPLKIQARLEHTFPDISFEAKDPNEEWDVPEELTVIDTVLDLKEVTVFDGLDAFVGAPHMSMHDFDALANLRYLQKLGRLKKVTVIGVPADTNEEKAFIEIVRILRQAK